MVNHTSNRSIKLLPQPECGTRSGPWTMISSVSGSHDHPLLLSVSECRLPYTGLRDISEDSRPVLPADFGHSLLWQEWSDAFQIFNGNLLARGHIL